ncbi:HAD family hydrolase [Metabacillus indicus]|uniref:HAD family hydrolase n=1 Tax=Metabacillus indicus TaxID=246786 RepID=UPI002491B6AA|nr:HAD family hydrolase [Metabacillus indicus]
MIKAIVFDFDGLILDTETHEYEVLQEIFQEHGSDLPMQVWGKVIGTSSDFNPYQYLEEQIGKTLVHEDLAALRKEKFAKRMETEGPRPGVEAYLLAAQDLGLKIGLASSSSYQWVSTYLKSLNLFDYFECIRTSDDVEKVKPDPALYIKAAECLGLKPEECLAFEDSANGALAAKRAGMFCTIVPNSVTAHMEFAEIDHRLESMAEMELAEVIRKIESNR